MRSTHPLVIQEAIRSPNPMGPEFSGREEIRGQLRVLDKIGDCVDRYLALCKWLHLRVIGLRGAVDKENIWTTGS